MGSAYIHLVSAKNILFPTLAPAIVRGLNLCISIDCS